MKASPDCFARWTAALALAATVCFSTSALATVLHLQEAQQSDPNTVSAWTFDGGDLTDQVGSNHLSAGGTVALSYPAGFFLGDAVQFPSGNGYAATASVAWPGASTMEFLLRPGTTTGGEVHTLSQIQSGKRNYFYQVAQSGFEWRRGKNDPKMVIIGTTGNGNSGVPFYSDHWYYVAMASEWDSPTSGDFTRNVWVKDLTDDGPLVNVVDNVVASGGTGGLGSAPLYVGRHWLGNTDFNGQIDALAYYNTMLSQATIESHVGALATVVPEPAALALLGTAGLGLLACTRRRRKGI